MNGGAVMEQERQARRTPVPKGVETLYHFSEDPAISRFVPHIPPSNPGHAPAVWVIDAEHAPLYWFPRHCPRVSVWARTATEQAELSERFGTDARRICAAETGWLERIRSARIYRYEFDPEPFRPWEEAAGQWIADIPVTPERVVELNDLLAVHAAADIELRITPTLGGVMGQILESRLPFGFVRLRDARR